MGTKYILEAYDTIFKRKFWVINCFTRKVIFFFFFEKLYFQPLLGNATWIFKDLKEIGETVITEHINNMTVLQDLANHL